MVVLRLMGCNIICFRVGILVTEMPIFYVNLPCTGKIFAAGAHTGGCTPRPPPDRYARLARRYARAVALRTVCSQSLSLPRLH